MAGKKQNRKAGKTSAGRRTKGGGAAGGKSLFPQGGPIYKNPLFLAAAIALVAFVAYLPALDCGFTNWDDDKYITENPLIKNLSAANIKQMFAGFSVSNYHPLTMLSFALDYKMGGLEPFGYHLVNVVFHLLNIGLVFWLAYLLAGGNVFVGGFVALFFGLHPMHVESVAWVSERKDVLYAFFMFASLIAYVKYLAGKKKWLYGLSFALFVLSCLSKPSAVVLPLLLLLLDWWHGRLAWRKPDVGVLLEKLPFFAVSLLFGILTVQAQSESALALEKFTLVQKFVFASYGFVMYLVKFFVPYGLSSLYPYPIDHHSQAVPAVYYLMPVLAAAICVLAWWLNKRHKVAGFGFWFYLINLVLVLQLITVGNAIMADRYTYVPYFGLLLALGWWLNDALQGRQSAGKVALGAAVLAALAFAAITFQRCKVWQSTETLWSNVIENYPDSHGAYNNRGDFYMESKQYDKAFADFSKSIALKPDYHDALNNRGNWYRQNGKPELAIEDFNKALEVKPDYFTAYTNRGNAYFSMQNYGEALKNYNKALELRPDYDKALGNRGAAYFQMGNYDASIKDLNRAIQLNPDYDDAILNRAVVHSVMQNHELALRDYGHMMRKTPNNPQLWNWMGLSQAAVGQHDASIRSYTRAIELNPKGGEYYLNRSKALAYTGKRQEAIADGQKALELGFPVDDAYRQSLGF